MTRFAERLDATAGSSGEKVFAMIQRRHILAGAAPAVLVLRAARAQVQPIRLGVLGAAAQGHRSASYPISGLPSRRTVTLYTKPHWSRPTCPVARTDRYDAPRLVNELAPGITAGIDDRLVGREHPVREPVGVAASAAPRMSLGRGDGPGALRSTKPSGPAASNSSTRSRTIRDVMPPIRAASVRVAPSWIAASASRRRARATSFARRPEARSATASIPTSGGMTVANLRRSPPRTRKLQRRESFEERRRPRVSVLQRLSRPSLKGVEADQGAGERGEGMMDVEAALVADRGAAKAGEPGEGALDDPSVLAQPLTALDAAPKAGTSATAVVVGLVRMRLVRAAPRSAALAWHEWDSVEQLLERSAPDGTAWCDRP